MAGSTCEAEYIAASEAAHEAVWIKEFITDLGVIPNASGPMTLLCDNTGAIALAKEPRFHRKTRHIKRRFNSIRESVQNGSSKERVFACVTRCEIESDSMPDQYRRWRENESHSLCFGHRFYKVCQAVYQI